MTQGPINSAARQTALDNIAGALDFDKSLPEQVFRPGWRDFLFFDPDLVMHRTFPSKMAMILAAEQATLCCMIETRSKPPFDQAATPSLCIDGRTDADGYVAELSVIGDDGTFWKRKPKKGPLVLGVPERKFGWIHWMSWHACSSDVGSWCIYFERNNEVALAAFRPSTSTQVILLFASEFDAMSIDKALDGEPGVPYFSSFVNDWKQGLATAYR